MRTDVEPDRPQRTMMSRSCRLVTVGITAAAILLACSDVQGPPETGTPFPSSAFVVSNPSPEPALALGGTTPALGSPAGPTLVYVSLPPGSIPTGTAALIRVIGSGAQAVVPMEDGGFDPVPVPAAVGDTLVVSVQRTEGGSMIYTMTVPKSSPPRVVKTSPPPHKRDVSLNAFIVVTFSEPMDSVSLSGAITLTVRGLPVAGRLVIPPQGNALLRAEFVPTAPLEPRTTYELGVGTTARDRDGDALNARVLVDFTTGDEPGDSPPLFYIKVNLPPQLAWNNTWMADSVISPPVEVTYQGCANACDSTYVGDVTIGFGTHPTGATLGGQTTVPMLNGIATFADLTIDRGGDYTLVASAPGAKRDTSFAFRVCSRDCWVDRAAMPTPRQAIGVGVADGMLYAVGGVDPFGTPRAEVEAYDPTTDTWTARAAMPTARYGFGLEVVNGILYAFGGMTASGTTDAVESYDPATDSWTSRAPLPAPRGFPGAGVANGVLYAVGGQGSDSTILSTVLAYDPATDRWSARASLPLPRSHVGVGFHDGLLYAIGGLTDPVPSYLTVVNTITAYDPAANNWVIRSPEGYSPGRLLPAIGVLPGAGIYVLAGADGVTYLTDRYGIGELYDPVTNQFTRLNQLPLWFSLPAAGVVDGVLYLVSYQTFEYRP